VGEFVQKRDESDEKKCEEFDNRASREHEGVCERLGRYSTHAGKMGGKEM